MDLREAVEAVGKIEQKYRSAPVDREAAAKLVGYSSLSGPANKALAALASYGLLERAGKGEARVTERARDILHAASEGERRQRLLEAALEPDLFRELRERFDGLAVPPEDGVVTYLNRQGFNPTAVRPAAKAFLETMSYLQELGASESHGVSAPPEQESPRETKGGAASDVFGMVRPASPPQREREKMSGERTLTKGMLSKEATFELIVTGQIGVKEIERLIAKLELDKEILAEPDAPSADDLLG
jgi:hypothetical protein